MPDTKRITHQFMQVTSLSDTPFDRLLIPVMLLAGVLYGGYQALQGDWVELGWFALGFALLLALAVIRPLQSRLLGQRLNRRHAIYIGLYWVYSIVWLNLVRLLTFTPATGKSSTAFYALVIMVAALTAMMLRALFMLTPAGYRTFIPRIPLWEVVLVAVNELIAAALLAGYVGTTVLPRLLQPDVFTIRLDSTYTFGVTLILLLYYLGMQVMWVQPWNDWLSQNRVWVRLMRLFAPLVLLVASLVIAQRFLERGEPRTADLLGDGAADLAVLSLGAVVWLVLLVATLLVYTSGRGLRQRFLPDALLDRLPGTVARFLRSISDMDMLLIIALLATVIPAYLFLLGDTGGVIGELRSEILQRGSALIETSEQALALLFAVPFYLLALALLILYAYVLGRPSVPASERDELVATLPVGSLIVIIITLYLFAVPVSQVLTEGRLPRLPQDLGRILAFNVLIPLFLLYGHYFLLVRFPYGRGQNAWRTRQSAYLSRQQAEIDQRIDSLNRELTQLDRAWHDQRPATAEFNPALRMETLYRYMQLNSLRDDLNMQRLGMLTAKQQLAEVSEAPVSIAVARLPIRIVSLGIPLLIAIQLYQWAVVDNGLREVINNPNITVDEFFRIILEQINF